MMHIFSVGIILLFIIFKVNASDVSSRLEKVENLIEVLTERLDKQQKTVCHNRLVSDPNVDNPINNKTILRSLRDARAADPVVAFSARITSDITPVGTSEIIVYDSVLTNYGNAYDSFVGRFQASYNGVYHFVATIMSYSSHYMEIEMVNDNSVLCRARASATYNAMGTCVANVHLNVGSDVWIRHYSSKGDYVKGGYYSSFVGHLISTL